MAQMPVSNTTLDRLDDQLNWYEQLSSRYQRTYKRAKVVEIAVAAFIPLGSALALPAGYLLYKSLIIGALGVLITVIEGVLHLYQYQQNWITYRCTAEALKHEKYLYFASAGPYATVQNPLPLLAERIEGIMSQENSSWASVQSSAVSAPPHTPP